jgi:hypothetical protein
VKYDALARAKKNEMRNELKLIALLSFRFWSRLLFFQLELVLNLAIVVLVLTLLYVTFFPNRKNAIGGIKFISWLYAG